MAKHAVAEAPSGRPGSSETAGPYDALREVIAGEGLHPRGDGPELRLVLSECAALARRRKQPPEQYLVHIKTCVREAGRAIDGSRVEAFMAQVVTISIAEYYRND